MQTYKMYILGARGTHSVSGKNYLEYGGNTSCYVLKRNNHAIILDCGTGMYQAKELLSDCTRIDIVLSHLHYDHIVGLLKPVYPRGIEVNLHAEFQKWGGEDILKSFFNVPFWPVIPMGIKYHDIKEKTKLCDGVYLSAFGGNHPNYASIVRLDLDGVGFCFATDYEHGEEFPKEAIEGCSFLLYDGTFSPEEYSKYIGWGHSDWLNGHMIAKQYGVKNLFIAHHDPNKKDNELKKIEEEAKKVNQNIIFAKENTVVDIKEELK